MKTKVVTYSLPYSVLLMLSMYFLSDIHLPAMQLNFNIDSSCSQVMDNIDFRCIRTKVFVHSVVDLMWLL